jgi:hypothetical protein
LVAIDEDVIGDPGFGAADVAFDAAEHDAVFAMNFAAFNTPSGPLRAGSI